VTVEHVLGVVLTDRLGKTAPCQEEPPKAVQLGEDGVIIIAEQGRARAIAASG
jgi:hypothetical protein